MDKAHTEAAHQKGPFPPFQKENFASQLVWLVMSFVVLYALLWKLVLPRVASILAARRARIEGDLAEAARAKAESEAALARYEKSLADARANAQAIAAKTTRNSPPVRKRAARSWKRALPPSLRTPRSRSKRPRPPR